MNKNTGPEKEESPQRLHDIRNLWIERQTQSLERERFSWLVLDKRHQMVRTTSHAVHGPRDTAMIMNVRLLFFVLLFIIHLAFVYNTRNRKRWDFRHVFFPTGSRNVNQLKMILLWLRQHALTTIYCCYFSTLVSLIYVR